MRDFILEPELFGYPTANLALGVGAVAGVLALISGALAIASFRRSGASIAVKAEIGSATSFGISGYAPAVRCLYVAVENRGMAAVQVKNIYFEVKGEKDALMIHPLEGSDLPHRLDGYDEATWYVALVHLLPQSVGGKKIRAVVLAAGKKRKARSNWVTIPVEEKSS